MELQLCQHMKEKRALGNFMVFNFSLKSAFSLLFVSYSFNKKYVPRMPLHYKHHHCSYIYTICCFNKKFQIICIHDSLHNLQITLSTSRAKVFHKVKMAVTSALNFNNSESVPLNEDYM
jgi:hypothetical protein